MENCKGTVVNHYYCCCCNGKGNTETGLAQVGSIMYAHILQSGYVKANGELFNRNDYSALYKYAKENNLILSETDWANDMQGMFAEGDGVDTFRVPDLRGQFLRGLDDGMGDDADRLLGSKQGDAIRNITASVGVVTVGFGGTGAIKQSVAPYNSNKFWSNGQDTINQGGINFDASRVVPTAEENRPKNIALIAQIKY